MKRIKTPSCAMCKSQNLEQLSLPQNNYWVIGDRRIYEPQPSVASYLYRVICKDCGAIQFYSNEIYNETVKEIFSDYGVMINNFVQKKSTNIESKLGKVCTLIKNMNILPNHGNLLDIGCGGGEFFSHFHKHYPEWNMYGMDIGEQFHGLAISNGAKTVFHTLSDIRSAGIKLDFISMNSVLFTVDNPSEFFDFCKGCMTESGMGFWLDACFDVQPWVIPEIEARNLFTRESIQNILERNGFEILHDIYDKKGKDVGYIFKKKNIDCAFSHEKMKGDILYKKNKYLYDRCIEFINQSVKMVLESSSGFENIGIYGTSLAGMYFLQLLREYCSNKNVFFVDEQAEYLESSYYDTPVVSPKDVNDSMVILPFAEYIASDIKHRMDELGYMNDCKWIFCVNK